jgi:Amt family ammonium transporter
MAGLAGWLLSGAADTPAARALALSNLPWVVTAAVIPLAALQGRGPRWVIALLAFLIGAVIYPLAGNWIWGGGWLANLSANLGLGHGLVDLGGAALVHVLGAAVAFAGLIVFLPHRARQTEELPAPLPRLYFPALSLLGPALILAGMGAWLSANPLLSAIDPTHMLLNVVLIAALAGLTPLTYTWLVVGRPDPLMAARGFGAGVAAGMALATFTPPWVCLATGALVGALTPFAIFLFDRILRLEEHTATLTMHGMGGAIGLLLLGIVADGRVGAGWNSVGANAYLGMAGQGVTGLLAASPFVADFPGQLQAQAVGLAAVTLFAFFASWIVIAPPVTVLHLLAPRRAPTLSVETLSTLVEEPDDPPAEDLAPEPSV